MLQERDKGYQTVNQWLLPVPALDSETMSKLASMATSLIHDDVHNAELDNSVIILFTMPYCQTLGVIFQVYPGSL